MKIVVAYSNELYKNSLETLSNREELEIVWITKKEDLTYNRLLMINPTYIFLPHWSFIIPAKVYDQFECVIFHMTDLPFGRGGSPLQNLISRGIYSTQVTALRCEEKLDGGPIYLKKPLSLHGNAEEIYIRASRVITEMIILITKTNPKPTNQAGEVVEFKRRRPEDGDISKLTTLEQVYNYIRMLDASNYPKAFLELKDFTVEFERASMKKDYIHADVKIRRK